MPNRIIRDWTDSFIIDKLSLGEEVLFTRLIMKADDFGNYHRNSKIVKSLLFPLKEDFRSSDIELWLTNLEAVGLIKVYTVSDQVYLHILNFKQRLRQKIRSFPEPQAFIECPHNGSIVLTDGLLEEKRREVEVEVEEKVKDETHTNDNENNFTIILKNKKEKYSSPGPEISYTIEHCLTVAMNDERWVKSSKASPEKLALFNCYLSGQGIYEKNPMDYKKHFFNWSKKQNGTHQQINGATKLGTSDARIEALKKW